MTIPDEKDPRTYVRLAVAVRADIESGVLSVGDPAPSITRLTQEHGVARGTAAKALRLLEAQGYVKRYAGLGYFVTERPS